LGIAFELAEVMRDKCAPGLWRSLRPSSQVPRHRAFWDDDSELEQFAV